MSLPGCKTWKESEKRTEKKRRWIVDLAQLNSIFPIFEFEFPPDSNPWRKFEIPPRKFDQPWKRIYEPHNTVRVLFARAHFWSVPWKKMNAWFDFTLWLCGENGILPWCLSIWGQSVDAEWVWYPWCLGMVCRDVCVRRTRCHRDGWYVWADLQIVAIKKWAMHRCFEC